MMKMSIKWTLSIAAASLLVVGCGGGDSGSTVAPPNPGGSTGGAMPGGAGAGPGASTPTGQGGLNLEAIAKELKNKEFDPEAVKTRAGVPVVRTADADLALIKGLAASKGFVARTDPFALLPAEAVFERAQRREKIFADTSGFPALFVEPEPKVEEDEILDPPPTNFRLSGIMQSNGIAALMTDGAGRSYTIRPGFQVPNTEWVVVTLDHDRAVLQRKSNKRPKTWVVRLQGAGENENLPASGGAGNNPSGFPGSGGPGRPGGPPGVPGGTRGEDF